MATLNILKNPLSIRDREIVLLEEGQTTIDYLVEHYPNGFQFGIRFFVNAKEYDIEHLDMELKTDDIAVVLVQPKFEAIITALITALVSTAISYVINLLFADTPDTPEFADVSDPTEVYNIRNSQNSARIGQYIPVLYGEARYFPDLCSQPYKFFELSSDIASPAEHIAGNVASMTNDNEVLHNMYGLNYRNEFWATQPTDVIPVVDNGYVTAVLRRTTQNYVWGEYEPGSNNGGYWQYTHTVIDTNTFKYINGVEVSDPSYYKGAQVSQHNATAYGTITAGVGGTTITWVITVYDLEKDEVIADISKNGQYINQLLCLGKGDVDVEEIYVGDTPIKNLEAGSYEWSLIKPEQHDGEFGSLDGLFSIGGGREFHENVITSSAVNGQRFDSDFQIGWFAMSEANKTGRFIEFDIEFPLGIHSINQSTGGLQSTDVEFNMHIQELDADLNPTGSIITTNKILTYSTNEAIRISFMIDAGKDANWQVAVERITGKTSTTRNVDFAWSGVKMYSELKNSNNLYNNTTILGIRLRATESISSASSTRISVRARRNIELPYISGGPFFTENPSHIAADIYLNEDYGAKRPNFELDQTTFEDLAQGWEGYPGFNGVFTGRSTVYEAMKSVLQPNLGRPLPLGSQMTLIHDGRDPLRTQLFSEENMVQDSFSIIYTFDEQDEYDGVEIEYLDKDTFDSRFVRYPEGCLWPESLKLFGCTDGTQAYQYANVYWNRKIYQRIFTSFQTELEGHIPLMGDRIAIQHTLPRWGVSGVVVDKTSNVNLILDKSLDWTGSDHVMMLRDQDGSVTDAISVVRGSSDNEAVLSSAPSFTINPSDRQLPTMYSFGKLNNIMRDFIITGLTPQGGVVVGVEAIIYDERVYVNGSPYLGAPF